MNRFTFTKLGRTLLMLTAVAAVLGLTGCGDDNGANSGGGNATVTIGGKKWTKKNLNVQTDGSWCYSGIDGNCAKYGRLYTWSAADGACRSIGMRLPSKNDWDALATTAGGKTTAGKKLKAKSGWDDYYGKSGNGTDDYGFSALPGGLRISGNFSGDGKTGAWWTATAYSSNENYTREIQESSDEVLEGRTYASSGLSVRCIKD